MKPPITLKGNPETLIFSSVAAAESYLEPPDIESERYQGYDSTGIPLLVEVHPTMHCAKISLKRDGIASPEALAEILRDCLEGYDAGCGHEIQQMNLDELMKLAREYYED